MSVSKFDWIWYKFYSLCSQTFHFIWFPVNCSVTLGEIMRYSSLFQFEFIPFIVCCRASLGAGPDATCEGGHVCTFPWLSGDAELTSLSRGGKACCAHRRSSALSCRDPRLLRTCWGFGLWNAGIWVLADSLGFKTTRGWFHADGSLVSSGPTGDSVIGPCGVQFTWTGARSPRDLPGGSGRKRWGQVGRKVLVCDWLPRVSAFRGPRRGRAWGGKRVFCVWCGRSTVFFGVWHGLLSGLPFPQCVSLAPFLWVNWPHARRVIFGLSILFLCYVCPFLGQFHTFLVN